MAHGYRFLRSIIAHNRILAICALTATALCISTISPAFADPPAGTFYYPPDNTPPGPPPNYNQIDTSYFRGAPPIPYPPPDSGGFYIWFDESGTWSIANHIYSQGNSLEQFHGSVLAMLDQPPTPGVNIFATNFELFGDTTSNYCYEQNDRWGWYQWSEHLYEIWWDVSTKEWRQGEGDPNDLMVIAITGCAIDFNIWSSGHTAPFGPDQVFLGESMIRLSDVPGFEDTYPGITDPYQSQAGNDPTGDPNITIFTPIDGNGASYNLDGVIPYGQTYPCGPVLGDDYGIRFSGNFVYEGNGIQFSSSCLTDPCAFNEPPVAVGHPDTTMIICDLSEICLPGYSFSDPDDNLLSVEVIGGTLDGESVCFVPVEGVNTIMLICTDDCGAADTAVTDVTITGNSPPAITCPADIGIDCASSPDPANTGYATADDDNDPAPVVTYSDEQNDNIITRTWTAVDDCGSSSQCTQTITLQDTTPPTLTCPDGLTLQCSEDLPVPDPASVTVSDDCDPAPVVIHVSDVSDGNSCPETITRTYRATDQAGNSAECTRVFIIDDDIAPVISCPDDITIGCADPITPNTTGLATATDNCLADVLVEYSDDRNDNIITRTWTATDGCDNSDQCVQTITITPDTAPPQLTCPDNINVQCPEDLPPVDVSAVIVSDDCDPEPTVTHMGDSSNGNTCPEVITRTYRATDASGNFAECTQVITIDDTIPPTINCPADISIGCNEPVDPSFTGTATASDNCQHAVLIEFVDVQDENVITRTWSAIDGCGNSASCVQTITITGTEPPVVTCPDDMTVTMCEIGEEVCIGGFFYDDPDGNIASVEVNVGTLVDDVLCFVPAEGENEIVLTVTDECGLTAECNTIITAAVNSAPEITCLDDTTIVIPDIQQICLPISMNDPDDTIETMEVTGGEMIEGELCFMPEWGINPISIVCTDSCGLSDVCEMNITVGCCEFTPGDANSDDEVDLIDVTMITSLYRWGTPLPDTCDCRPENPIYPFYGAADVDGDCSIYTLFDITYLIYYVRGSIEEIYFCPCCPPTGGWVSGAGGDDDPSPVTTRYRNSSEGLKRIE
jgi:hypothetical protein